MATLAQGDRAFMPGTYKFGTVTRRNFLGIKDAVVVTDDSGNVRAYAGEPYKTSVASVAEQIDPAGNAVDIPVDVLAVGPTAFGSIGLDAEAQRLLFAKYNNALTPEERKALADAWKSAEGDEAAQTAILEQAVQDLDSDAKFWENEGKTIFSEIPYPQEIGDKMMARLTDAGGEFPPDKRDSMILEWDNVKTNVLSKKAFLKSLADKLVTDEDYVKTQGAKALTAHDVDPAVQTEMLTKLIGSPDAAAELAGIVSAWKDASNDPGKQEAFVSKMSSKYMSPEDYAEFEGKKVLASFPLDDDTKASMLEKFTALPDEDKANYVAEWRASIGTYQAKELFLDKILEVLLGFEQYVLATGARWLAETGATASKRATIRANFLALSDEEKADIVSEWREALKHATTRIRFISQLVTKLG